MDFMENHCFINLKSHFKKVFINQGSLIMPVSVTCWAISKYEAVPYVPDYGELSLLDI